MVGPEIEVTSAMWRDALAAGDAVSATSSLVPWANLALVAVIASSRRLQVRRRQVFGVVELPGDECRRAGAESRTREPHSDQGAAHPHRFGKEWSDRID